MSARPPLTAAPPGAAAGGPVITLADVAAKVLEETPQGGYRVRPAAWRMVTRGWRCRRGHVQAVIVRTPAGTAVVYRPADTGRTARDVWCEAWDWELPGVVSVTCHCRVTRRVDLSSHRAMR